MTFQNFVVLIAATLVTLVYVRNSIATVCMYVHTVCCIINTKPPQ